MNPNTWFNEISSKLSDTMISMMGLYIYQKGNSQVISLYIRLFKTLKTECIDKSFL